MSEDIRKLIKSNKENFPVASILIPKKYRSKIMEFYKFARTADDISDSPHLSEGEKLELLGLAESKLLQGERPNWAIDEEAVKYGLALIKAFRQDVVKNRYENFEELMEYCKYSANPVGRYILHIMDEKDADLKASDALCSVLQIINHIQDYKDDYLELNRIYLPLDKLGEDNIEALTKSLPNKKIKATVNYMLDKVDTMLDESKNLLNTINSKRLLLEIKAIYFLAKRLARKLRYSDV